MRKLFPFDKDVLLHLRIPFSFFLLPVFLFGISQATKIHAINTLVAAVAMHLFIYPASNAYNSYMDQDTGPIGGLEHPPPATRQLYFASIWFDVIGLGLCLLASWQLCLFAAGYVAFSKSYSWHGLRAKKYPIFGWAFVAFFQGGYTYALAGTAAANDFSAEWYTIKEISGMVISTLLIGAYYPLTQIYQHAEDRSRGDKTISLLLGVKGTMLFSGALFGAGAGLGIFHLFHYYGVAAAVIFSACLLPAGVCFTSWFLAIQRNTGAADYRHAMRMTKISSACTVTCFLVLTWLNHHS